MPIRTIATLFAALAVAGMVDPAVAADEAALAAGRGGDDGPFAASGIAVSVAEIADDRLAISGLAPAGRTVGIAGTSLTTRAAADGTFGFSTRWRPADCLVTLVAGALRERALVADCGPAGPRGQQGPTGAAGARGQTGAAGRTGATGSAGARGATGSAGATGAQGLEGPQGAPGIPAVFSYFSGESVTPSNGAPADTIWIFVGTPATQTLTAGQQLAGTAFTPTLVNATITTRTAKLDFCYQDQSDDSAEPVPFLPPGLSHTFDLQPMFDVQGVQTTSMGTAPADGTYLVGLCINEVSDGFVFNNGLSWLIMVSDPT